MIDVFNLDKNCEFSLYQLKPCARDQQTAFINPNNPGSLNLLKMNSLLVCVHLLIVSLVNFSNFTASK